MIKEEIVPPVRWKRKKELYCDNCGEKMKLLDAPVNTKSIAKWWYECPKCGLIIVSPKSLNYFHKEEYICIT